jgi:hypothetical protein
MSKPRQNNMRLGSPDTVLDRIYCSCKARNYLLCSDCFIDYCPRISTLHRAPLNEPNPTRGTMQYASGQLQHDFHVLNLHSILPRSFRCNSIAELETFARVERNGDCQYSNTIEVRSLSVPKQCRTMKHNH